MSNTVSIVITLVSVAVGGLITWWVARFYYVAASKDLLAEAQKLHNLTVIALRALEAGGVYKLARDSSGNIVGLAHQGSGDLVAAPATLAGSGVASSNESKET